MIKPPFWGTMVFNCPRATQQFLGMLLVFVAFGSYNTDAGTVQSEVDALHSLYLGANGNFWTWRNASTAGPKWNFQSGANINPCSSDGESWQGIQCTATPTICNTAVKCSISAIILTNYNATGTISSELTKLTRLQIFSMGGNGLYGPIPQPLFEMSSLVNIQLWGNKLGGYLPSSISSLQALTRIDLSDNHIGGTLPTAIGDLTNLIDFDLESNELVGSFPSAFCKLSLLELLTVSGNSLIGSLPGEIGMLTNLKALDLRDNSISGTIPFQISSLQSLTWIDLSHNGFEGPLFPEIGNLVNLRSLVMVRNLMTGTLPVEIFNLTNLIQIDIRENLFHGSIPSSIGRLSSIVEIEIAENLFSGTLPEELGMLVNVRNIFVRNCLFEGAIPSSIFNLPVLSDLELHNNQFTGTLPEAIGNASRLQRLECELNLMSGTLPVSMASLSFLFTVTISSNYFSGPIPFPIELKFYVDVSNNLLSGRIDSIFAEFSTIQFLYLHRNYFSGPLPSSFGNYLRLEHLFIFENQLSGPIPKLKNCTSLTTLLVQDNLLSGQPDAALDGLLSLIALDLSSNKFSGELPRSIWSLPRLSYVSILNSCFSGEVPEEICMATSLVNLVLEGLHSGSSCVTSFWDPFQVVQDAYYVSPFDGTVPNCIWKMSTLETLHLSGNILRGTIPDDVRLPRLLSLGLAHNRFSGSIPPELQRQVANSTEITVTLNHNRFSGTCSEFYSSDLNPREVSGKLDLRSNRLSGIIPTFFTRHPDIKVLVGNIFHCDNSRSEMPDSDPEKDSYICGSADFDVSLSSWAVVVLGCTTLVPLIALILISLLWKKLTIFFTAKRRINESIHVAHKWRDALTNEASKFSKPNFSSLILALRYQRRSLAALAALVSVAYAVLYQIGKSLLGWGTHNHQYRWQLTSAYMSSEYAALSMLLLLIPIIVFVEWSWRNLEKECGGELLQLVAEMDEADTVTIISKMALDRYHNLKAFCFVVSLNFSHMTVIVLVKGCIIYALAWLELSPGAKVALQLTLAGFDITWNNFVIPKTSYLSKHLLKSDFRITNTLLLLLFNSIVAPLLCTAFVNQNCFSDIYYPNDDIETTYLQPYCSRYFQTDDQCNRVRFISLSTSFTPPFTYSYACTSALITSFLPSLIFSYAVTSVVPPGIVLFLFYNGDTSWFKKSCFFGLAQLMFPFITLPIDLLKSFNSIEAVQSYVKAPMLGPEMLVARTMHALAVLLTFGIASPFLGVAIGVHLFTNTTLWLLIFGRYIYRCRQLIAMEPEDQMNVLICEGLLQRLEISCLHVWSAPRKSFYIIVGITTLFFGMISIDVAGDKIGWEAASLQFVLPALLLPFLVRGLFFIRDRIFVEKKWNFQHEGGCRELRNRVESAVEMKTPSLAKTFEKEGCEVKELSRSNIDTVTSAKSPLFVA